MKNNRDPLKSFTKKQLQEMQGAIEKTQQQYINGKQLIKCPLCSLYVQDICCIKCPHILFNNMNCCEWLQKNSSLYFFSQIFTLSNSTEIKQKCIDRLELWKNYIWFLTYNNWRLK